MASRESFVHLHNHSEYSMLDGAAKIKPMVAEAARLGQPAIGLTDHGYLFGAYEFYAAAKAAGIQPIIGLEAYVTPGTSRFDRQKILWGEPWQRADDVSAGGAYNHLTLIAYSTQGVHNLFRLGSHASLDGQFGKWPRADKELLERYHEGLIVFSGCPSGAVQTRMRLGQWDEAVREAAELRDIFGPENFYVEIMDHGIEFERRTQKQLLELAKLMDAPLVATNDAHYVKKEDRRVQDALLCINSGSRISDPDRFKFDGDGYYIRSSEEMRDIWKELPQACDATLEIAERCEVEFRTTREGASYMPDPPVPAGEDKTSWFIKEVERGLRLRFPQGVPEEVRRQAEYEEDVIISMGFPGYFLTVADYINWAKEQGIRVGPGRGSGAGSMVAYAMRITELNPLEHGLIFERFLNPERVSMPDFDIDFDERRRDEVIEYVKRKYGEDRISQVVTYGTIKTKQALKDSARILGRDFKVGEQLTKALPPSVMGKDITVAGIFDPEHKRYPEASEFRKFYEENPDIHEVVEYARGLEGITRQWGVHACAVIMSSHPLMDIIPIMKRPQDGAVITQFDYPTCETLGLLKMDFLGLRNLTVISDALENISLNGKEVPDLDRLGLDDRPTYELLGRGETLGVFQLDGGGMRDLLKLMKPDNFEDISAVGALYRPGPMGANSHTNYALRKNGRQEITPIHAELAEPLADILGTTFGLIVYQEQVMQIAQKLAGYSLGQADMLRRAMGKKKKEILDKEFEPFSQGMLSQGYSMECIQTLWDILVPFSDYAFNKAHSAAYGLVSYWTAYLKANYVTEYMAALLTSTKDNKDRRALYLAECRHQGITVLQPDVNASMATFAPDGADIRFGLSAIQNVGANVVEAIVQTRAEKGNFSSFQDFLDKVPQVVCNKRTIQSLIRAGAFDSLGYTRRALLSRCDEAIDAVIDLKRNEAIGQFDLFGAAQIDEGQGAGLAIEIPDVPEFDRRQKLAEEREMLGLYVSDHPLRGVEAALAQHQDQEIATIVGSDEAIGERTVRLAGLVSSVQTKVTKQGNPWAVAVVEDLSGSVEVLFFPRAYETIQSYLVPDIIVQVEGRTSVRDDQVSVYGQSMTILDLREDTDTPLKLTLPATRCTAEVLTRLREVLEDFPGASPVQLYVTEPGRTTIVELDSKLRVSQSSAFFSQVKAIVGVDGVVQD
ncbi:DNA polymerase III subunit alpha [Schaalia sp. lx-100]|uniref:DNA polymerase III subunit alpha n=1 Tax=Schaalia sp. lx-100 TaxID=2899081 RepID=UPI001E563112|nr:DNA polymerase III subunit alpha [Schaalia sp. lx-100]MCD4557063.1 DNA polymerase III subunit alpha [Schaalia sp. lx-100]